MQHGPISIAPVETLSIADIDIGVRRRTTIARLGSLKASIAAHGLVNPILVRGQQLVAGHRRLEACRALGWTTIPARQLARLSDEEMRAVELEENTAREALNDFETSKARVAEMRLAEAQLKAKAEAAEVADTDGGITGPSRARKSPTKESHKKADGLGRGRPKGRTSGSQRDVAGKTGISKGTQQRAEAHVDIAERYPFMQRDGWVQYHVLEAGTVLDQLPDRDRATAAALLDQPAIPPKTAIRILRNLAAMPAAVRGEVLLLARSPDPFQRSTALTRAAAVPAPLDPGLTLLGDAENALRKAAAQCREATFKPRIQALAADAKHVLDDFEKENADARRQSVSHVPQERHEPTASGSIQ